MAKRVITFGEIMLRLAPEGHTFPLDQMNEAMETNVAQSGIKICYINDK